MKGYKRGLIAGAIVLFAIAIIFGVSQTYASQSIEKSAENVVSKFFDAGKNGDIDTVIDCSIDMRPGLTNSMRREVIKEQKDLLKEYNILSAEKVNDQKVVVRVKLVLTDDKMILDYPVIYNGDKWVLDITNAQRVE
ncbi:MAG: hypothetical protein PHT62_04110 [Desulfotomaculaceae bacterium]|nr:hypothetical protein [Desulfotomaculaceae bacterium]